MITKQWNGKTLTFRDDGYFNMTKAAKQFGKKLSNFWDSPDTAGYMYELSKTLESRELTLSKRGRHGGTWAHPKLAVFFARWLDVRFAVACDAMIEDILHGYADVTITNPEESAVMNAPTPSSPKTSGGNPPKDLEDMDSEELLSRALVYAQAGCVLRLVARRSVLGGL